MICRENDEEFLLIRQHDHALLAAELLGAVGLLVPATRIVAAVCLLLLMLAMFPANIYAARMPNPPKSMTTRLPLRTAEEIVYLAAAVMVAIGGS